MLSQSMHLGMVREASPQADRDRWWSPGLWAHRLLEKIHLIHLQICLCVCSCVSHGSPLTLIKVLLKVKPWLLWIIHRQFCVHIWVEVIRERRNFRETLPQKSEVGFQRSEKQPLRNSSGHELGRWLSQQRAMGQIWETESLYQGEYMECKSPKQFFVCVHLQPIAAARVLCQKGQHL